MKKQFLTQTKRKEEGHPSNKNWQQRAVSRTQQRQQPAVTATRSLHSTAANLNLSSKHGAAARCAWQAGKTHLRAAKVDYWPSFFFFLLSPSFFEFFPFQHFFSSSFRGFFNFPLEQRVLQCGACPCATLLPSLQYCDFQGYVRDFNMCGHFSQWPVLKLPKEDNFLDQ
jgi:hypothetical protein